MADSINNPIRMPFPDDGFPMLDDSGRITQVWREFFMRLFARTGSAPGVDAAEVAALLNTLQSLVDQHTLQIRDLYLLAAEQSGAQVFAAMLARIAALEGAALPAPVAVPYRPIATLPEPVQVPARASDDLRKLMEVI